MKIENKKYVHVMPIPLVRHNDSIIDMINKSGYFKSEEHLFIVASKDLYDKYKEYNNIIYEENLLNKNFDKFDFYIKDANYIFLHNNSLKIKYLLRMKRNNLKKIIWVVWGSDLYGTKVKGMLSKIKKKISYIIRKYYVSNYYYGIGIGFKYDMLEIRKRYGQNVNIIPLPYGYEQNKKYSIDKIALNKHNTNNGRYRIMIGHSAYPYLNHIEMIKKLEKYKNENILISLILSYGDENYANLVKTYAINTFGINKVEIIDKYMSKQEYNEYLNTVDICILDNKRQAALSNVWRILYLNKKLFLNENSIIKLGMDFEDVETYSTRSIDSMDFKEFIKENRIDNRIKVEKYLDESWEINTWNKTLRELN